MPIHHARWRGPLGLAAAAIIAGVLVPGPDAAASAQDQHPYPIVDGTADWGLKESFRNYVTGPIGQGQVTVGDGATGNDDGTFRFGAATGEYDPATHDLTAAFTGTVQFQAHADGDEWQLDLTLSGIAVSLDNAAQAGELTADVVSRDMGTGEYVEHPGVTVAELDLSGVSYQPGEEGSTVVAGIPAVLAEDGAAAFAGFYQPGTELDPVTLTVQADAAPPGDGGSGDGDNGDDNSGATGDSDDELALTGPPLAALVAAGAVLMLAGVGTIWLTRRRRLAAGVDRAGR